MSDESPFVVTSPNENDEFEMGVLVNSMVFDEDARRSNGILNAEVLAADRMESTRAAKEATDEGIFGRNFDESTE